MLGQRTRAAAGVALSIMAAAVSPALAGDDCHLTMIASLEFGSGDDYSVSLPVTINNVPTHMLVDTGGVATTISDHWARDQRLRRKKFEHLASFWDYDGNPLDWYAYLPSLQIGTLHATDVRALIQPGWLDTDVVGTLGPDFLLHYDVEFDFANHVMKIFTQDHCPGAVVYWTHDPAAVIPVKIDDGGHVVVEATLDGQTMKTFVDTGATTSVLKMSGATDLFGLRPDSPGVTKISDNPATGGDFKYTFKTLSLAGMNFSNPTIMLAGDANPSDSSMNRILLLGVRQLSKLHLFISYKEKRIYATAAGAH